MSAECKYLENLQRTTYNYHTSKPLIYLFCFYFSIGDFWKYHILITLHIRFFISTNSCFMKALEWNILEFGVSFSQSRGPNFENFSMPVGPNHGRVSLDTKYVSPSTFKITPQGLIWLNLILHFKWLKSFSPKFLTKLYD